MKMSKSIKDYKDAMDSIKISDSFYKRTEVLLNESSSMEIVKSSPSKIKVITRSVIAAAACLLLGFGVKTVIDNRTETDTAVVTEIVQETTVVTVPVTVPETASPVIDRIEEGGGFLNDSGVLVGDMPAIPEEEIGDAAEETFRAVKRHGFHQNGNARRIYLLYRGIGDFLCSAGKRQSEQHHHSKPYGHQAIHHDPS